MSPAEQKEHIELSLKIAAGQATKEEEKRCRVLDEKARLEQASRIANKGKTDD